MPAKTVALTFDDGPHPRYTDQVLAILKKYGLHAVFFEIGQNVGTDNDANVVKLGPGAAISHRILESGSSSAIIRIRIRFFPSWIRPRWPRRSITPARF